MESNRHYFRRLYYEERNQDQPLWRSAALPDVGLIDSLVVLKQGAGIRTIVILRVIAFLLNSSGVELTVGEGLDINKDLKSTGMANLVSGITISGLETH